MEGKEKLYWVKVLLAILLGFAFSILQSAAQMSGFLILFLGLTIYLPLSDLFGRLFSIERAKAWKIGIGAYFFTWLTAWIIFFTMIHSAP